MNAWEERRPRICPAGLWMGGKPRTGEAIWKSTQNEELDAGLFFRKITDDRQLEFLVVVGLVNQEEPNNNAAQPDQQ